MEYDFDIFTGTSNVPLAEEVAGVLGSSISPAIVDRFSDGEIHVEIQKNVRGRNTFILQSTCAPSNESLMEVVLLADALKRSSAAKVTAILPYLGYSRQDKRTRSARVPISTKIIADIFSVVGIDRVLTVDLHSDTIQGFFNMPADNIYATKLMSEDIKSKNHDNIIVVSPDVGGTVRSRALAKKLNDADLAIIEKRRSVANQSKVMNVIGDVKGKVCIINDDIVDTAGTLCNAAAVLKERGAHKVHAYITHPVLSGPAIERISSSVLDELIVTNSIPLSEDAKACDKIKTISLAPTIAESIIRINKGKSLIEMFS